MWRNGELRQDDVSRDPEFISCEHNREHNPCRIATMEKTGTAKERPLQLKDAEKETQRDEERQLHDMVKPLRPPWGAAHGCWRITAAEVPSTRARG